MKKTFQMLLIRSIFNSLFSIQLFIFCLHIIQLHFNVYSLLFDCKLRNYNLQTNREKDSGKDKNPTDKETTNSVTIELEFPSDVLLKFLLAKNHEMIPKKFREEAAHRQQFNI